VQDFTSTKLRDGKHDLATASARNNPMMIRTSDDGEKQRYAHPDRLATTPKLRATISSRTKEHLVPQNIDETRIEVASESVTRRKKVSVHNIEFQGQSSRVDFHSAIAHKKRNLSQAATEGERKNTKSSNQQTSPTGLGKDVTVPQAKAENKDILSNLGQRDEPMILDTFSFAEEDTFQPLASKLADTKVAEVTKQETLEEPTSEELNAPIGVDQGVGASHNTFGLRSSYDKVDTSLSARDRDLQPPLSPK